MNKKKSAVKTAAAAAMAALMAFSFTKAEKIDIKEENSPGHEIIVPEATTVNDSDFEILTEEELEEKKKSEQKKRVIKKLFNTAKGGASFLLAFAAKFILGTTVSLSGKTPNPILGFLSDILVNFIVIALLFAISFKMIHPNKKLKELFTLRNILFMLLSSTALALLKAALTFFSDKAYFVGVVLQSIFSLLILSFLWYKIFNSENTFGKILKKALSSSKDKYIFAGMILATLLSAMSKLIVRKMRFLGTYCDLIMIFLICTVVIYCGYMLFRPKKKVLLLN